MKYGLLNYEASKNGWFNIGDHIQSLAAEQFLPHVDKLIYRDRLNEDLGGKYKTIMNGWYTSRPKNWPPTQDIIPLFISFHLNSAYANILLSKPENVAYLKTYEPIGCRDYSTLKYLKKYGVNAYYSFCLTTTLGLRYKIEDETERTNEILMVDVLYKENYARLYKMSPKRKLYHLLNGKYFKRGERQDKIRELIPERILSKAITLTHDMDGKLVPEKHRFDIARALLNRYARAKLVITSRIHCALPCLAMGTPVVFIHGGALNNETEIVRLRGTINHLNVLLDSEQAVTPEMKKEFPRLLIPGKFEWEGIKNPETGLQFSEKLKRTCFDFIAKDTEQN